ncbi:methanol O-anthraniloyltransferase [Olea europaea subsp. europaea]|uniref:Methanol O-anthraniloyltransferase n=1 Tax=Olea europaea subsp. europaea TaxID=158383 RepID=A0A8S0UUU2_OLEEU|nr:methanol O-anthraniloyltransferase [Olea europaea subsp. europaea]
MSLSSTFAFTVHRREPELVAPSDPTPREIKKLSDIDDQEGHRFQVPGLIFYKNNPSMEGKDPVGVIREGLAKTLVYFYPFAGRIMEGDNRKLMVNCNGKGVLFVEADANIKVEQLGHNILPPCPFLEEFLHDVPGSGGTIGCPLLLFQVTRFTCGGFALGIRFNHTMADGYGVMQFLNTMTEFSKGACEPPIHPVWQREQFLNARSPPRITCTHNEFEQITHNKSSTDIMDSDKSIRTAVFFTPKDIQALRNQVLSENFGRCTRFDLITACLWKCRTIALNPADPDEMVRISVATGARGKPGMLDIPTGYYGNVFTYPAAVTKAGTLCKSPLSYAVHLVQNAKAQLSSEYIQSVADLMVIKKRPKYTTNWIFIVSDITRVGLDTVDFGWGNPVYGGVPWAAPVISFYSNFKNSNGEDGVVVPICLPPLTVEKFQYELKKMTSEQLKILH